MLREDGARRSVEKRDVSTDICHAVNAFGRAAVDVHPTESPGSAATDINEEVGRALEAPVTSRASQPYQSHPSFEASCHPHVQWEREHQEPIRKAIALQVRIIARPHPMSITGSTPATVAAAGPRFSVHGGTWTLRRVARSNWRVCEGLPVRVDAPSSNAIGWHECRCRC